MLDRILTSLVIKNRIFFSIFCLVVLSINSYAQIQKPNIPFNNVCAGLTTNYNLIFSFNSTLSNQPSNQFIVELSDENGLFANPTQLTVSNAQVSPVNLLFQFPSNLIAGSNYRIRVRSTSPIYTSPPTDAFSAQFMIYNESFTINNFNHNQSFCQNSGYVLSIDNTANSPLQYPQLKYKWFRDGNLISGEILSSINVTLPGNYYVQVDYGTCDNNAYSHTVSMFAIPVPILVIASENNETVICPSTGILLTTSNISSLNSYQWYLNDSAIPNANNDSYTATEAGVYHLKITTPNCGLTSNNITLTAIDDSGLKIFDDSGLEITSGSEIAINPGEQMTITASGAESYEWKVDNVVVGNNPNLVINQAEIIELNAIIGGCTITRSFIVTVKEIPSDNGIIPNTITPNNDNSNETWILPDEFVGKEDVEVVIFTASNEEILRTKNYSNNWPLEGFVKNNTVYYYKILKNNSIVAKGTLSIITK
jgi:hypothetical protein